MNLGYPLEVPWPGKRDWGLTVITDWYRDGTTTEMPLAFSESQAREIARRINAYYGEEAVMPEVSEANAPANPLNAAIEKAAGSVASELAEAKPLTGDDPAVDAALAAEQQGRPIEFVEAEPAALVPEGAPSPGPAAGAAADEGTGPTVGVIGAPNPEGARAAYEAALKAKAAAMEAYIQAGIDKVAAAVGQTEIVTVAGFKAAVEALLRHLHADHPENYL